MAKNPKIVRVDDLARSLRALRQRGKKIVFTNGCFDLLHAGHVRYLRAARALGDVLVVGVNTDASVRRLKGAGRPLMRLAHRAEMLSALEPIDFVVPFAQETPEALIRCVMPDVLVKGADYKVGHIVGADTVRKAGGRVVRIPMAQGLSTSALIAKICRAG